MNTKIVNRHYPEERMTEPSSERCYTSRFIYHYRDYKKVNNSPHVLVSSRFDIRKDVTFIIDKKPTSSPL